MRTYKKTVNCIMNVTPRLFPVMANVFNKITFIAVGLFEVGRGKAGDLFELGRQVRYAAIVQFIGYVSQRKLLVNQ